MAAPYTSAAVLSVATCAFAPNSVLQYGEGLPAATGGGVTAGLALLLAAGATSVPCDADRWYGWRSNALSSSPSRKTTFFANESGSVGSSALALSVIPL